MRVARTRGERRILVRSSSGEVLQSGPDVSVEGSLTTRRIMDTHVDVPSDHVPWCRPAQER